jgi:hypothetical protein
MVVCVVALLAAAVVPSARADVVRLSRQEALAALARPAAKAVPAVAAQARAGAPTVTTGTASAVTAASATVGGMVNPNGRRTTYHFDYGTTTAYGSLAPSPDAVAGSDRTAHAVSVSLTGLLPGTTYHFRIVGTNSRGTAAGADATFTTAPASPPAGTYTNPVFGSFPDPMALRTSVDYYAYATGANFPILHSTDLVNWSTAGTAFTATTFPAWSSGNPWAPSALAVSSPDGRCGSLQLPAGSLCFVLYYTGLNNGLPTASNCIGVAVSARPDGGFVDQGILDNGTTTVRGPVGCGDAGGYSNIDPAPFIDTDGQAYLYFETGHNASGAAAAISVVKLAPDLVHALGPRTELFTGTQAWEQRGTMKIVEGPWMRRHSSRYYLFYSGGDWQGDYAMGYGVGTSPLGPFAKSQANPILTGTASVIGPGGGSVATGPATGADQMIYHARSAAGQPRTLRVDRLVWNDASTPATVAVNGPTTTPQPLP